MLEIENLIPNISYDNIESTIQNSFTILEKIYGPKRTVNNFTYNYHANDEAWFDDECYAFKSKVSCSLRHFKHRRTTELRLAYCDLKRRYHSFIYNKKKQFLINRTSKLLSAANNNDSRKFWAFFKSSNGPDAIAIPSDELYLYFR